MVIVVGGKPDEGGGKGCVDKFNHPDCQLDGVIALPHSDQERIQIDEIGGRSSVYHQLYPVVLWD